MPDVGFSRAQLTAAQTLCADLAQRAGCRLELAFLGGDRAVGLGHLDATVDLYLVGRAIGPVAARYEVDGTVIRVRELPADEVAAALALGRAYRATNARSPQLAAPVSLVRELVRAVTGTRLCVSPRWAEELDAVDEDAVRRILIGRSALRAAAAASHTFTAMLSGDLFTAVSGSATALLAACQAALAAAGDLECAERHVFRRLARTAPTEPWCDRLWWLLNGTFAAGAAPAPAEVRELAERRLLAANQLLSSAVLEGWAKRLVRLPDPDAASCPRCGDGPDCPGDRPEAIGGAGGDRPEPGGDGEGNGEGTAPAARDEPGAGGTGVWREQEGLRRSAYFMPVPFADALTLVGPGQAYQISEDGLRLWRRLDGRPLTWFVRDLVAAEPAMAGLSLVDVDAMVTALQEAGAAGFATGLARGELTTEGGPGAEPEPGGLTISLSTRFAGGVRPDWA